MRLSTNLEQYIRLFGTYSKLEGTRARSTLNNDILGTLGFSSSVVLSAKSYCCVVCTKSAALCPRERSDTRPSARLEFEASRGCGPKVAVSETLFCWSVERHVKVPYRERTYSVPPTVRVIQKDVLVYCRTFRTVA